MAQEWYVTKGGKKHGPMTSAKLKQIATKGKITRDDLVWRDGFKKWVAASEIKGLFKTPPDIPCEIEPYELDIPDDSSGAPANRTDAIRYPTQISHAPTPTAPKSEKQIVFGSASRRSKETRRPRNVRRTDIFAIIAFSTGLLSLYLLPIILAPICCVASMISYYRLRENPDLKGHALRITGAIMGTFSILYLMWLFESGPLAWLEQAIRRME